MHSGLFLNRYSQLTFTQVTHIAVFNRDDRLASASIPPLPNPMDKMYALPILYILPRINIFP